MKTKLILTLILITVAAVSCFGQNKTDDNPCPKCETATWEKDVKAYTNTLIDVHYYGEAIPLTYNALTIKGAIFVKQNFTTHEDTVSTGKNWYLIKSEYDKNTLIKQTVTLIK